MSKSYFDIDKLEKRLDYQTVLHFLPHIYSYAQKVRGKMILKGLKKDKFLDAGVGCGWISRLAIERGFDVTGIDSAQKVINENRWFDKQTKVNINIKKASIYKLPFNSNSFETVVICEMLEHLEKPQKGIKEAFRVLKRGGKFKLLIPGFTYNIFYDKIFNFLRVNKRFNYDVRFSKSLSKYKVSYKPDFEDEHRFTYTVKSLKNMIEKEGFNVVKVENVEFLSPFVNTLLCNILKIKRDKVAFLEKLDTILMSKMPLFLGSDWMFTSLKV